MELLNDETRAVTRGGAAAHRGGARGSRGLASGRRSRQIGQPTAGGARPRLTMVAEGDRDGIIISE